MIISGKEIQVPLWYDDKAGKDRGAGVGIEGRMVREERCAEWADEGLARTIVGKGRSSREEALPAYEW
jgi:hypothetical protein